ncbi:venom allergen 5-like isoform X1 [Trichogramma pretiosum]|uniref:venom allergen 5-like isoform X1 n=1 Tax=Trichogramma pretiosum TaxID=7493 RepID=UPI000C71C8ED|nr:venom allergen 5-like isoform X1 [Trichogramma pretiosum]
MESRSMRMVAILLAVWTYGSAPGCLACSGKTLLKTGVTCQEKQEILEEHNRLRSSIALGQVRGQPGAKFMMEMVWDDELASVAQRWADHCNENHDSARHIKRFLVGQNLARTWTTKPPKAQLDTEPEWRKQINKWFDEVRLYRNTYSPISGHFTQVIWGETYAVGCGFSYYYDPWRGYTKNYVCNYGPSGNVLGIKPYVHGWPECHAYGVEFSSKYSGLCSKKNHHNNVKKIMKHTWV